MQTRGPNAFTSRTLLITAAALAFAVVALSGAIAYRGIKLILSNFAEARKDANTIVALDQILYDMIDAETGQRGFILTGNVNYLDPYNLAVGRISDDLRVVEQLTSSDSGQRDRFRVLRRSIDDKVAELSQTINVYNRDGEAAATALVNTGRGRYVMGNVRRTLRAMLLEEERQRDVARVNADASSRRALESVIVSTAVAVVLLLLTFTQFGIAARANERAREESESANRVKDQFIATVSHELRSPLTAILGWSAMLEDPDIDRQTILEAATTIQSSASVQKKLIEDLLDVSRIMTGKLRLSMRTIDLRDVISTAVDAMRPAAAAKSIALVTTIEPGIRISADGDRLQQVVWNIMTNAVKFTARGGSIAVNVAREASHAVVEIRDSGEGMDASFLPHVFEPFRQSDSSRARVHNGLGLGLSIVKYLVEAHGGTVSASSAGKGQGTMFRVSLPIMPIVHGEISDDSPLPFTGDIADARVALPEPDALRGLSLLVVDDDAPTLSTLSFVLKKCGAGVLTASSSAEALAVFRAQRPDVVVSDIGMPDEDGLALLGQIRAFDEADGGLTPAVALTAYVRKEDSERLLACGFQAYLTKPVEPLELVNAVHADAEARQFLH